MVSGVGHDPDWSPFLPEFHSEGLPDSMVLTVFNVFNSPVLLLAVVIAQRSSHILAIRDVKGYAWHLRAATPDRRRANLKKRSSASGCSHCAESTCRGL